MARYILFVQCAPNDGQDDDFNRWYDERHLADICGIAGVKSARRFEAAGVESVSPPHPYATIYELDTDEPESVLAAIRDGAADGSIPVSDTLDRSSAKMCLFRQR